MTCDPSSAHATGSAALSNPASGLQGRVSGDDVGVVQALPRAPWAASLAPRYGIHTAREVHDWFLRMMQAHEEFEVDTDQPGEWPVLFASETVRWVKTG